MNLTKGTFKSPAHSSIEGESVINNQSLNRPAGLNNPGSDLGSPITPEGLKGVSNDVDDQSVIWTKISKYGRGKHPKKPVFR